MKTLVKGIAQLGGIHAHSEPLRGKAMAAFPVLSHAWLLLENGWIHSWGSTADPSALPAADAVIDAQGATVLPAWCDSHTHLVFAGSRENEMVDKINGLDYAAIAAKGGGILSTARAIAQHTEDELYELAAARVKSLVKKGTGALEIKSGYGLDVENELKMLRVIHRLKTTLPIPIRASFLGAHSYPLAFRQNHEAYLQLIEKEMLPAIAQEGLADYIDVFCEAGFFSLAETQRICRAGQALGMGVKLHANQLSAMGAVELGVALGAVSVDHLEQMDDAAIAALSGAPTIGTLLPGAAFFLRLPQPPAREMLAAGAALALASDFNPGSCPSGNMNLMVALACIQAKLLPEEALNAATFNGAMAMGLGDQVGSIAPGKRANLIFTQPISSLAYLPYAFGDSLVDKVMVNGQFV